MMKIFFVSSSLSMMFRIRRLSDCCSITISVMSFTNCCAEIPPKYFSPVIPVKLKRLMAAKRTLKNSSKLLENIPKNRKRSNKGTEWSPASCKTRALKANQLFSLSIYLYANVLFILNLSEIVYVLF